jgi:iron complex transport system substrate-binding protein
MDHLSESPSCPRKRASRWIPAFAGMTLAGMTLMGMTLAGMAAGAPVMAATSPPQRIVTLSPHLAELVCAAGACERLAGVVAWSDFPESVKKLPQVGDAFAVNVEQIFALQPDLVLAWDGGTARETQERLRSLKLPVEGIAIRTLPEIGDALEALGRRLGTEKAANAAVAAYRARLEKLRAAHAHDAKIRVMYQIEASPAYSVNHDSPISQVIELCGGTNVFADLPALAGVVSLEAAVARDPQVILYTKQDNGAAIRALWARSPEVSATRAGNLYEIDGNLLDRATPRMLDGAEQVCAALAQARKKP